MNFVFLRYPILVVLEVLCLVLAALSRRISSWLCAMAVIVTVMAALVLAVPYIEILLLLLPVLMVVLLSGKERK